MIKWNQELYHYGIPRRSGRYKWGSGENPYHHGQDLPRLNVRKTKEEIKSLKKHEKLHKRAGAMDWHNGNFSSRKLHKNEAANAKAQREKLQKLLDEHIPMIRNEKLAKGSNKYTKNADRRTNKQAKDYFSYDKKVTEPIAKKYDAKVEEMNKYLAKYEKTRSQSDYEKYIAAEQKAWDYLDELAEHVIDVDEFISDRNRRKK